MAKCMHQTAAWIGISVRDWHVVLTPFIVVHPKRFNTSPVHQTDETTAMVPFIANNTSDHFLCHQLAGTLINGK